VKSKVLLIDTEAGNIPSVLRALSLHDCEVRISNSNNAFASADALVLPGVGAFPQFMKNLADFELTADLKNFVSSGGHLLGICVGMQAFSRGSEEFEFTNGLGVTSSIVSNLNSLGVKRARVPHVGWNLVHLSDGLHLTHPLKAIVNRHVYFMHSFAFPLTTVGSVGSTDYEIKFCSAIQIRNAIGVQFHPEKSHKVGFDFFAKWISHVK